MKFNFKRVGDTLSVDEYNALCYLLAKQEYKEAVTLEEYVQNCKYCKFKLRDNFDGLVEKHDGYIVYKEHVPINIDISHNYPNANFYITLKVVKSKTVTDENGVTNTLYPSDVLDNLEDVTLDEKFVLPVEEVTLKADYYDTYKVMFSPLDEGISKDDYISKDIVLEMKYDTPIINWADGDATAEDEIICENFRDIQRAIISTPDGSLVKLKLYGNKVYDVTDEIMISGNKQVYIRGGNHTIGANSILDAGNKCRFFTVSAGSLLDVQNCTFRNGNGSKINKTSDLHKKAGAINMNSRYDTSGDAGGLIASFVNLNHCKFINCHADRGGAIYNMRGKLNIDNCEFDGCQAASSTNMMGAMGGAIMTESQPLYNGASNTLNINPSTYSSTQNQTTITMILNSLQNVTYFTNNSFTLPQMKCYYNNHNYDVTLTKQENQYKYEVVIPVQLPVGARFYLYAVDFSQQPSLCTRLLKVTDNDVRVA